MRQCCFVALYNCFLSLLYHIVFYMIGYDISRRYKELNYPFATIDTQKMGWWKRVCILPKNKNGHAFLASFEIQKNAVLHWIVSTICVLVFWTCAYLFSSVSRDNISTIFIICILVDMIPVFFYLSFVYWQINHVITVSKEIQRISSKQLQKHIVNCQKNSNLNPNNQGYKITEKRKLFWTKIKYTIVVPADNGCKQAICEVATVTKYRYCSTEITQLKSIKKEC